MSRIQVGGMHSRKCSPVFCLLSSSSVCDAMTACLADVCLMRFGGLLEYDSNGVVRHVRAIVEHQTMHMVEFGEPERLMPRDADR